MGAAKEYYLKLSEEVYNNLGNDEKLYLNYLGLQVNHLPSEELLNDENYKKLRKQRLDAYNSEQEYIFKKTNKII